MKTIIFDIETGPVPQPELEGMIPPFDPAEVKLGNLKDPEKIAAKLADAESAHRRDFLNRAALDATTGQVLAIGLCIAGEFSIIEGDNESVLLRNFWTVCRKEPTGLNRLIGFNIVLFDLPFLIRRSFKYRVEVPFGLRRGRYWAEEVIDLRDVWQCGDRQAHGSLNAIAGHLGLGQKNGSGEQFARLWQSDRAKAVAYLQRDVELTFEIARALRVIEPLCLKAHERFSKRASAVETGRLAEAPLG